MNGPQTRISSVPVQGHPAAEEAPAGLKPLTELDVQRIRECLARASAQRTATRLAPVPPPRYDDVFFQGTEWLGTL